jgi:hypothetical protein
VRKTLGPEHAQHNGKLYKIKSFFKIKLKDDNLSSRLVVLMKILKCPPKAFLNGFSLNETILVLMQHLKGHLPESISKKLRNQLGRVINERERPKISDLFRIVNLGK